MPKYLRLRSVSAEEETQVRELGKSRRAEARLVQRARIICALLDNPTLSAAAAGRQAGYSSDVPGREWVKRFNERGIAGLEDEARAGRPPVHSPEVRSKVIDLALQKPTSLGLPFALWTLERLQRELQQREGIYLSDSTIWEWVNAEGLVWKRQQSWFHEAEKHDPEFVEKRGP
jgi:transposase